jgi:hypothetical protein
MTELRNDFDDRNMRNRPGLEGVHVDFEEIRIEAHRHVEEKAAVTTAPAEGMAPGAKVTIPVAASTLTSGADFSTPSAATRTVPATGFTMSRA